MGEALVSGKRGVVEAPVGEIVGRSVAVPFGGGCVEGNLHPVPLRLVVPEHRRCALARVRPERHENANQQGEESYCSHRGGLQVSRRPRKRFGTGFRRRRRLPTGRSLGHRSSQTIQARRRISFASIVDWFNNVKGFNPTPKSKHTNVGPDWDKSTHWMDLV